MYRLTIFLKKQERRLWRLGIFMSLLGIISGIIGLAGISATDYLSIEVCLKQLIRYQAFTDGEIAIDVAKNFEDCLDKISDYKLMFTKLIAISIVFTGVATFFGLIITRNQNNNL